MNGFFDRQNVLAKGLAVFIAVIMSIFFAYPDLSYGDNEESMAEASTNEEALDSSSLSSNDDKSEENNEMLDPSASETYITVRYNEYYNYDDEGNPIDVGQRLLGEREFPATVGNKINVWDYVADIPGFFLWDGWSVNSTVSANPDDNIIELFYMRLSISTYTVNYYAMTGADLTADNWNDALATNPEFHFLGQNTYTGQLYGKLVNGDKHAVDLEDAYIAGTFPESIRLTLDPDKNIINVLYVPKAAVGPDNVEIVEKPAPDTGTDEDVPDNGDENIPPSMDDDSDNVLPPENTDNEGGGGNNDDGGNDENEGNDVAVPPLNPPSGFPPMDIIAPDNSSDNEIEITDDMLENAPTPEQAQKVKDAYQSGIHDGEALAQTGDDYAQTIAVLLGITLLAAGVLGYVAWKRSKE